MLWLREIGHCSTRLEACGLIETTPDGHLLPFGAGVRLFHKETENARKREMIKNRFDTEHEANNYKLTHQLANRVAEPIGGDMWGLIFPIRSHIQVNDGAPDGVRLQHVAAKSVL